MLLSEAKKIFEIKLNVAGGLKMPDDEMLGALFYEALIFIATKCIPRELLRNPYDTNENGILRFIGGAYYIENPNYPNFEEAEKALQIDEDLNYAVINKAVALFSRKADIVAKFETEAAKVINRYKANYRKISEDES